MRRVDRSRAEDRLLGLVGLGVRAGRVVTGVDATRALLQRGQARAIVLAADASERALGKVVRLASATGIPVLTGPVAEELGARIGRPPVMVVGVRDRDLAKGMLAAVTTPDGP